MDSLYRVYKLVKAYKLVDIKTCWIRNISLQTKKCFGFVSSEQHIYINIFKLVFLGSAKIFDAFILADIYKVLINSLRTF